MVLFSSLIGFAFFLIPSWSTTISKSTNPCADLLISNLRIVEEKRRCVELAYTLVNAGNAAVSILGDKKSRLDNLAIQAYFSGDRVLNKGDVLADGLFLAEKHGKFLMPNDSLELEMHVRLKKKTNHIGVLILKVDATNVEIECNETNNSSFVIFEW